MAMTGFDPAIVSQSIGNVKNSYENLMSVLGDQVQTQFVNGMSDKWACTNAQAYFNEFKQTVDALIVSANEIFDSVVTSMNGAAAKWAEDTNTEYSTSPFDAINKVINVDCIQENIAGVRGVDVDSALSVSSTLPKLSASCEEALTSAQQAVAECGFIGGDQAANLSASLGTIKTNIANFFTELATSAENEINRTVEQYADTAGQIAEAFAGQM